MAKRLNKEKLKAFISKRWINYMSLVTITLLCIVITVICLIAGFARSRVDLMIVVSVLLVLLCFVQAIRMKKSYRTIPSFKGSRKKKKREEEKEA